MPITIVVETGAGVAGANSYQDRAAVRAFAAARGVTLSIDDDVVGAQLVKASDWLQARESSFIGVRSHVPPDEPLQPLAWPRKDDGCGCAAADLDPLAVPVGIVQAQAFLVMAQFSGFDISPTLTASSLVTREKVGPLEVQYATPTLETLTPQIANVDGLLEPFIRGAAKPTCGSLIVRA